MSISIPGHRTVQTYTILHQNLRNHGEAIWYPKSTFPGNCRAKLDTLRSISPWPTPAWVSDGGAWYTKFGDRILELQLYWSSNGKRVPGASRALPVGQC